MTMIKQAFHPYSQVRHRRRGLTILWLIVFFLLLMVFAAFGIQLGWLRVQHTRAHVAAEASALAAANTLILGRPAAAMNAEEIAAANIGVNDSIILVTSSENDRGDLRFGRWHSSNNSFEDALLAPDAVAVTVRFQKGHPNGPVPRIFGGVVGGTPTTDVSARAIAHAVPREPVPPALIVLDSMRAGALTLARGSTLNSNGRIGVQSRSPEAITIQNTSSISAPLTTVDGGIQTDSDESLVGMLKQRTRMGSIPAYLDLPLESLTTQPEIEPTMGSALIEPGYYPSGLVASEGTYVLRNGIYMFGGPGVVLNRNATLSGEGVIVVLDEGANFDIEHTQARLIGPSTDDQDPLGSWAGLTLTCTIDATPLITISSGANLQLDGALHMPSGELEMSNATLEASLVVVDTLKAINQAQIDVGGPDPHPIDVFLVD